MKSIAPSLPRLLPRLLVAVLVAATMSAPAFGAEAAAAAKPDPAKGEAIAGQVCGACHTSDGSRGLAANPILQGQHPEYLVKQLMEFKDRKRENAIMLGMASTLSEADMRDVAAFYASKHAKPGFAKDKDTVRLAERIYRGGIAERQIPACSGCHTPDGGGIPAQFPRLAGQHAEYAEAQLLAFRDGLRKNGPMMTGVAARLSDKEIKALADYMAGLR